MKTQEVLPNTPAIGVDFSDGHMVLSIGQRFPFQGSTWKIQGIHTRTMRFGDTNVSIIRCAPVEGQISDEAKGNMENGKLDLQGDKIAEIVYQEREAQGLASK